MENSKPSKIENSSEKEEPANTYEGTSLEQCKKPNKGGFLSSLTDKQKHRLVRTIEVSLGVIAVVLIVACIFLLCSDGATVKARVNCANWSDSATKTELAIYNYDAKDLLTDGDPSNDPQPKIVSKIQPNEDKVINDIISGGTYTLAVYTTPVLEDGTTFKKPEPQVIEFNGEDVVVEFDLVAE